MDKLKISIYVIGFNGYAQFGLNHKENISQLTEWNKYNKNIEIKQIDCCFYGIIYSGQNNRLWASGGNYRGQCGLSGVQKYQRYIMNCREIEYFKENNIKISNICVNVSGECTFWITNRNKLYGNGYNYYYQLGLGIYDNNNKHEPEWIEYLDNIIDARCGADYSIALCKPSLIISNVIRNIFRNIMDNNYLEAPDDIIKIIIMFYDLSNVVWSTGHSEYGGNGQDKNEDSAAWKPIEILKDENIIKIECGEHHSLFLSQNGSLWCCGRNDCGQLGFGHFKNPISIPMKIGYFDRNNIKIVNMKCGSDHNLALNDNGKIYSWGYNSSYQCGDGSDININQPQLIKGLMDYKIIKIDCGRYHSYAMSDEGEHFLFGMNNFNQCSMYNGDKEFDRYIFVPECINKTVEEQINGKKIKSVHLGFNNTVIVAV